MRAALLAMLLSGCAAGLAVVSTDPTARHYACDGSDGRTLDVDQTGEGPDDPEGVCSQTLGASCRCVPSDH